MSNDSIKVNNLNYKIDKKNIINNINMSIDNGTFVSVIGPNGSGKSTLLKILAGIIPNNDAITVGYGYLDTKKKSKDLLKIGFVFNDINKMLFNDVYEEFSFVLENINTDIDKIEEKILEIAEFFGIEKLLDKKSSDLTKEELQIVNIVVALIHEPEILILDNPFSMMKSSVKKEMLEKLKYLHDTKHLTIILATNNLSDIILSDYTYVLDRGSIVIEGATIAVLQEEAYLKNLGLEIPFSINLSMMLKFYEIYNDIDTDYNEVIDKLWN